MPLLICDPEAIILESMNRCHLYVFLFQCNLCSANGTRTPHRQTQPRYPLDDLMSTGWTHAIAKERQVLLKAPPRSDISVFRAPGGKAADGQIQLPPLSKSPTPRTCHLISPCGCGPSVRKHFATRCPPWLKSGRAVSEGWPPLLLLTHFSQVLASLCQAGKPTKELLGLPEAQIRSSFSVWGEKKKIQPLSSGGGGGSLRKPEP